MALDAGTIDVTAQAPTADVLLGPAPTEPDAGDRLDQGLKVDAPLPGVDGASGEVPRPSLLDARQADSPISRGTVTSDAVPTLPPPRLSDCVRVDEGEGYSPSLFAAGGRWYVFFVEGTGTKAFLRVRSAAAPGLVLGTASNVLAGATRVDLIADGGRLRALASRQFYAVPLESTDGGAVWTQGANLITSPVDALCAGYTPVLFARGAGSPAFVTAGVDINSSIFGCVPKVAVAFPEDGPDEGGWRTPAVIGSGYPVLAYQGQGVITIAATFGVYVSSDGGDSFSMIKSGDTTAEQIRGTSGAASGHRLALAQSYSYGVSNPNTIAVLFSDDEGRSWPRRIVLRRSSTHPGDPMVAFDGDFLSIAWQDGGVISLMTSPDFGTTWSIRGSIAPVDGGSSELGGLAVYGTDVALALAGDGVSLCTAR